MSDAAAALAAELGGRLPDNFRDLDDEHLVWLLEAVREVRNQTATSLEHSTELSVESLPALMRGPARSVLGKRE